MANRGSNRRRTRGEKRVKGALRFLLFGLWALWVLYLGMFVYYEIQRYNSPDEAPARAPFAQNEARYAPPTPAVSLTLFVLLGFVIPGAIYVVPRAIRRRRASTDLL